MLAAMLAAILDFSARHHLCQFMPAVSETTDNREHFDIWQIMILLYVGGGGGGGVRVTPRKSGQFHSLSPYHTETRLFKWIENFTSKKKKKKKKKEK